MFTRTGLGVLNEAPQLLDTVVEEPSENDVIPRKRKTVTGDTLHNEGKRRKSVVSEPAGTPSKQVIPTQPRSMANRERIDSSLQNAPRGPRQSTQVIGFAPYQNHIQRPERSPTRFPPQSANSQLAAVIPGQPFHSIYPPPIPTHVPGYRGYRFGIHPVCGIYWETQKGEHIPFKVRMDRYGAYSLLYQSTYRVAGMLHVHITINHFDYHKIRLVNILIRPNTLRGEMIEEDWQRVENAYNFMYKWSSMHRALPLEPFYHAWCREKNGEPGALDAYVKWADTEMDAMELRLGWPMNLPEEELALRASYRKSEAQKASASDMTFLSAQTQGPRPAASLHPNDQPLNYITNGYQYHHQRNHQSTFARLPLPVAGYNQPIPQAPYNFPLWPTRFNQPHRNQLIPQPSNPLPVSARTDPESLLAEQIEQLTQQNLRLTDSLLDKKTENVLAEQVDQLTLQNQKLVTSLLDKDEKIEELIGELSWLKYEQSREELKKFELKKFETVSSSVRELSGAECMEEVLL